MLNIRLIIFIVFCLLTLFNMMNWISITEIGVFGMTAGAIFITLADIFENNIIKNIYYLAGGIFIGVFPFLKNFKCIEDLIKSVDQNTFMLASISALFLSIYINHENRNDK